MKFATLLLVLIASFGNSIPLRPRSVPVSVYDYYEFLEIPKNARNHQKRHISNDEYVPQSRRAALPKIKPSKPFKNNPNYITGAASAKSIDYTPPRVQSIDRSKSQYNGNRPSRNYNKPSVTNKPNYNTYKENKPIYNDYKQNKPIYNDYRQNKPNYNALEENKPTYVPEDNEPKYLYEQNKPNYNINEQKPNYNIYEQNKPNYSAYEQNTPNYNENGRNYNVNEQKKPNYNVYKQNEPNDNVYEHQIPSNYKESEPILKKPDAKNEQYYNDYKSPQYDQFQTHQSEQIPYNRGQIQPIKPDTRPIQQIESPYKNQPSSRDVYYNEDKYYNNRHNTQKKENVQSGVTDSPINSLPIQYEDHSTQKRMYYTQQPVQKLPAIDKYQDVPQYDQYYDDVAYDGYQTDVQQPKYQKDNLDYNRQQNDKVLSREPPKTVYKQENLYEKTKLKPFSKEYKENEYVETVKEKRQAHHDGGHLDANGQEFASKAAEVQHDHDHGKRGGRLTFQIHGQKGPHSYRFGYDTGKGANRQFRYEERDNYGQVHGRYGFYDDHGKLQVVNYSAHPKHGFSADVPKH